MALLGLSYVAKTRSGASHYLETLVGKGFLQAIRVLFEIEYNVVRAVSQVGGFSEMKSIVPLVKWR